jgi:periplasmic mercuric ion binding protein
MNTTKLKGLLATVITFFVFAANAQNAATTKENPRKMEVTIKTTVECALCKKNLESKLGKFKGVRTVTADFAKKEVQVVYNSKKVTVEEIKKAIADIGYDADEVKANNKMLKILEHKAKNP